MHVKYDGIWIRSYLMHENKPWELNGIDVGEENRAGWARSHCRDRNMSCDRDRVFWSPKLRSQHMSRSQHPCEKATVAIVTLPGLRYAPDMRRTRMFCTRTTK